MRNFLVVLCVGLLVSCAEVDEKTRLRQALDDVVSAVENRSVRKVNQHLTADFKTASHSEIKNIQSFMQLHFRSNTVILIFTSDHQLAIEKEQGQISFNALVTGSSHWLPERGRHFFVKTAWKKSGGDWKLNRLDWEKAD